MSSERFCIEALREHFPAPADGHDRAVGEAVGRAVAPAGVGGRRMGRDYYNEHDPFAAAWLRQLIAAGALPAGDVDERSIEDVTPADLAGYRHCH